MREGGVRDEGGGVEGDRRETGRKGDREEWRQGDREEERQGGGKQVGGRQGGRAGGEWGEREAVLGVMGERGC